MKIREIIRKSLIILIEAIERLCLLLEDVYLFLKPLYLRVGPRPIVTAVVLSILSIMVISRFVDFSGDNTWSWRNIPINHLITNEMSDLEEMKSFDRDLEKFLRRWDVSGASFALMRNDSLIYAKGYGYANLESKTKCDVKHTFRIASV